jgi:(p)ppGpp synthase/HD superfamily hydrolase
MIAAQFSVDDAIVLAVRAHRGQRDRGRPALPYVTHPLRVMSAFDEPELQMIAVLHDVAEDTVYDLERLREEGVPEPVLEAVDALTKRNGEDLEQYWSRVRVDPLALKVKLVDVDDNADPRRLALLPQEDAKRLAERYARARVFFGQEGS